MVPLPVRGPEFDRAGLCSSAAYGQSAAMVARIPIAGPSITSKEIDYVTEAVKTAWYGDANVFHERFEAAFAAHCGGIRRFAAFLHLRAASCPGGAGGGRGRRGDRARRHLDRVGRPVRYVGATPVFADIDAGSWCLSPEAFDARSRPHQGGDRGRPLRSMPDWDRLAEIAAAHGVALIEDAAEAIGSRWRERPAGSFGAMSAFSFHGSKTLTTGEGGMLVLDDDRLLARVLQLRDHGRAPGDRMFFNAEVGYKYKMSAMQAALGLAQLERLDELVSSQAADLRLVPRGLAGWNRGILDPDVDGLFNSYWMTTLVLHPDTGVTKEALIPTLSADGIDVRPFFYPLSAIPAFRDTAEAERARQRNKTAYAVTATASTCHRR